MSADTCPDQEQLRRLAHGKGAAAENDAFVQHLAGCQNCAALLAELSQARTLPGAAESLPLDSRVQSAMDKWDGEATPSHARATAAAAAHSALPPDFLAPAQAPDEIGRLGTYRVLKVLGSGGMGVVFLAEDPGLQRLVALKAMLPSLAANPQAKQRFLREARAAAAVKHDHIVAIYQVGEDRGVPFLAMEFLEGESLEDRLKCENKVCVPDVVRLGRQIAEGLAAAHAKGLVHRDIKPGNIWLETRDQESGVRGQETGIRDRESGVGSQETVPNARPPHERSAVSRTSSRVKILDFGLARPVHVSESSELTPLTQSGTILGTPAYMAPEQAAGRAVDHRSDLFSLGCVLYRMAAGVPPFKGSDPLAILSALALETPPPPVALNRDVPRQLSDLVMRLLAKEPQDRPASARAVADELAAMEAVSILRPRGQDKPGAKQRRRWLPWAVAAGLLLAAAVTAAILLPRERFAPTDQFGTLIIESAAPEAEVIVNGDHDMPLTGKRRYELKVKPGKVAVALKDKQRFALDADELEITNGDEKTVRVTRRDTANGDKKKPPDHDRKVAEWVLKLGGSIHITGRQISPERPELPKEPFELLSVKLGRVEDEFDLARFAGLANLKHLDLADSGIGNRGLAELKELPALRSLIIRRTRVTDDGLAWLESLPDLEVLSLGNSLVEFTGSGLSHLKQLKSLRHLDLLRVALADDAPGHIAKLSQLEGLNLSEGKITPTGLAEIAKLPKLQTLNLFRIPLGGKGMASLKGLTSLTDLNVGGTQLGDGDLVPLRGMKEMKSLSLRENPGITDAGLKYLLDMKKLKSLDLSGNAGITDAGLKHLFSLKRLGTLRLEDTKVTPDGVRALKKALPGCQDVVGVK